MFSTKSMTTNNTYTKPTRITFSIKNFTGGLNNVVSPSRISDSESPDLLNVRFRKDGVLEKRSGLASYNFLAPGHTINGDLNGAWVIKVDDLREGLLLHVNRDLIYVTTQGIPVYIPWGQASQLRSIELSVAQFQDKIYFVDNGLRVHFLKIEELEDDNPSPNIYYICDPPVGFTPKPKPATKGVTKEAPSVYGKPNMIDTWYEPCEYELEDGYKGLNVTENFRKRYICVHKDRLYIAGNDEDSNMLYISDILNPFYFPASLPIQTPPDGDRIVALKEFGDSLIIGRKDSMFALTGNTNRPGDEAYKLTKITTHTGVVNHKCIDNVQGFLFYVGNDSNLYKMSYAITDTPTLLTRKLNNTVDLKKAPLNKTKEDISNAHTFYDKYNGEWWVQLGKDSLVYNYDYQAWTRHTGCDNRMMLHYQDKFTLCRENCTFTYFDDTVYYDYDYEYPTLRLPIPCYWTSKDIDFGEATRIKQIRDTYLVSEVFDEKKCDIRVKYDVDYVPIENESRVESEISLWDKARWDKNRFISTNIARSLPIMVGRRGRTFRAWIGNGYVFKDYVEELPHQSESEPGDLFFCNGKFYVRIPRDYETREYYRELSEDELYQPMKIYELSGLYEFKGYR